MSFIVFLFIFLGKIMFSRYCIIAFTLLFSLSANAGSYEDVYADIAKRESASVLKVKKTLDTRCAEIDEIGRAHV